jgi:hypothetical protein
MPALEQRDVVRIEHEQSQNLISLLVQLATAIAHMFLYFIKIRVAAPPTDQGLPTCSRC